jgi:hypothetical protein
MPRFPFQEKSVLDKIPPPVIDLIAPAYVWVLGLLGAVVGYLEDFKWEDGWKVWLLKFLTKCSSSALAAVLTYHALIAMGGADSGWSVVLIGISAHMGTEALKAMGEAWKARAGNVK